MEMSSLERKVPPVLVMLIALIGIYFTDKAWPMFNVFYEWRKPLSYALIALGISLGVMGIVSFKRAQTTLNPVLIDKVSALVKGGIFRYSRNPMYLGMLLIVVAFAVRIDSLIGLLWGLAFIAYMNRFQILPEERMLQSLFGQAYQEYCQQVRRWL